MVGLFLQSGYALLPSQPHHRVSSRLTRNLILFVARQISPEHADRTISLKDIEQARTARRRALRADIATRTAKVAAFLPQSQPAQQTRAKAPVRTKPKLSLYKEDRRP